MDYHLRVSPRGTELPTWDIIAKALDCSTMYVHQEGCDNGLHYHVYLTTKTSNKTIRNRLMKLCKFPVVKRGEENSYYMLKEVPTSSDDWKELDFRKFTLGYTAKEGKFIYGQGSPLNYVEAAGYYLDAIKPKHVQGSPLGTVQSQGSPLEKPQQPELSKTDEQYVRYCEYVTEHLDKTDIEPYSGLPVMAIKYWSMKFFRSESPVGLLPQKAHINRFIASFIFNYMQEKRQYTTGQQTQELISLGYV